MQFTSNDRLHAIGELATITDAKLLSKVALLFWDVLDEDYNSKDNNQDVSTERDSLFRNLNKMYSNNKIFNNKDNPYPTSQKAISVLNHMFKDENFDSPSMLDAIHIANKIGVDATPAILAFTTVLKDEEYTVCRAAAKALGEIESPAAIPALTEVLKHEDYSVRRAARDALITIVGPIAVPALIEALKDKDQYVRYVAVEALAKIEAAHPGSTTTAKQKDSGNSTIQAGSAEPTQKESDRGQ
ncbi:MAG: HEAT repeat domain-containing protein [Deltaproteobacteria bacterium]|nr:HEAT repeat domain-containing protein [Deltaproteobacteria bacterium]